MGALTGLRVIDMSRVLAGPWCGQVLADLGAEVIKIERPIHGDDTRGWGPPYMNDDNGNKTKESSYYMSANRGKQSVSVNIATPEGQELIRDLATGADILLENYKVGDLAKYGLDYKSLSKINPRLIYCSITGFGQNGPRAQEPGYDFIIQGLGGLMSVTGERDDLPGGGPQKAGVAVSDLMTGLYAVIGIEAALYNREKTGKGQYIDIALLDTQVAMMANQGMNYLTSKKIPKRFGNAHANIVPYQVFSAADRDFIIACGNDSQFVSLCNIIGLPDLPKDPRFTTNASRVEHRPEIVDLLSKHFLSKTADEWVECIATVKVPVGAINNIEQAMAEPQIEARKLKVHMPHPLRKDFVMVGCPINLSDTPVTYQRVPPQLGEHTKDVLKTHLGLSDERIAELEAQGIIDILK